MTENKSILPTGDAIKDDCMSSDTDDIYISYDPEKLKFTNIQNKSNVPMFDINKDLTYPYWLAYKIFTIEFYQTMYDLDKQKALILKMLDGFPSIRRFVCYYDYSPKIKDGTFSKHHYHGYLATSNFVKLNNKYGSNKKGIVKKNHDLLIWMRDFRKGDTLDDLGNWDWYIKAYGNGFKEQRPPVGF